MKLLIIVLIALLFAKIDADFLNAGYRFKDHTSRFLLRALLVLGITFNDWYLLFISIAVFYLIFDYALNLFRGLPFFHQGKTSIIDKLWFGNPGLQLAFKLIFLTITILIQ